MFGKKVVTINTEEGAAYGVALLAAVGAGGYKNIQEACRATIRVVPGLRPPDGSQAERSRPNRPHWNTRAGVHMGIE